MGREEISIDLNCDLGESFGRYTLGEAQEIVPLVSSVNIACGVHAGDPTVMESTVALAVEHGVAVGAHPGYPDLQGFGRRALALSPREIFAYVVYQVGALQAFCRVAGTRVRYVKPHGALYNRAAVDGEAARAIVEAIRAIDRSLILLALSGSLMVKEAQLAGVPVAREFFADRGYQNDGTLVPRSHPHALVRDPLECAERISRLVREGRVVTVDGTLLPLEVDSICVHGDTPGAVEFLATLHQSLQAGGIAIAPFAEKGVL